MKRVRMMVMKKRKMKTDCLSLGRAVTSCGGGRMVLEILWWRKVESGGVRFVWNGGEQWNEHV